MNEPKVSEIKKYLSGIAKINRKYVTSERLSRVVGNYPEIISDTLSYFEPTLKMDPEFNLMELVPVMKQFVINQEENKNLNNKKVAVKKKDLEKFESINDFIYQKMTSVGGLLDRNVSLSDTDLRILKKLITEEQANRKNKK
ncbi:MAG: hypothetical protein J6M95_02825 [Bacilli bacterium]|nr:hypothetical protein [Bacilli bacterium]